ncbi:hypothetical protein SRABI106_02469 [Rahnella aquatilis]|nr:hypothetical protein SRABI106_02469 [Rahnella aquatilis]
MAEVLRHVRRDSKTDTDAATLRGNDGGVNTNQFTFQIEQCAPGVTAVNRRIGLNKVFQPLKIQAAATKRRNNAGCHRLAKPKRIANGDGKITDTQVVGIRHRNLCQIFSINQLDHRNIRLIVFADEPGFIFTAIVELNVDFIRIIHHVVVGEHIAFGGINNNA